MSKLSLPAGEFISDLKIEASGQQWLDDLRSQALSDVQASGFPTQKVEEWKYTNIAGLLKGLFSFAETESEVEAPLISGTYSLVFTDGIFSESLSNLPEGFEIKPLSKAIVENAEEVEKIIGQSAIDSAFTNLNKANVQEGVFVKLEAKQELDQPLHILYIGATQGMASMPRNIISLGQSASAEILEDYITLGDEVVFSNSVTDIQLAKNAELNYTKNQAQNDESFHIGSVNVSQERDSRFNSVVLANGSKVSRNYLDTALNDENAFAGLQGLYAIRNNQLADNHTAINHNSARTYSDQLYKGILDDRSRGVFNGKVFIARDAQQVDSSQMNKNLLLSQSARVDTKPELDVYADDVKAAHGAAIGQLNDDELFYIQSRCISKEAAMAMLVHGHMEEIIAKVKSEAIRQYLDELYLTLFDK
ncbi:MAG: Fe-S cluster assembly protein SufD [Lentisphaeraceae bacterium]|nr:Fe-S cluster assembly protein SufD [Lentisphaeraceae bacterium]